MKKPKIALGGAGFYIVLLLCLTAAGAAGYGALFSRDVDQMGAQAQTAAVQAMPDPAPVFEELDPAGPSLEILEPETEKRVEEELAVSAPVQMPSLPVETAETMAEPVEPSAPRLVVWPLRGEVLAAFSVDALNYDETMGDWRTHAGLDLAAEPGTQVTAACAGTVRAVEEDPMMGTVVTVDHGDGYATTYANLQTVPAVKPGDRVSAGQIIGAVGATAIAEAAQPSHLHFAVEKDGDAVDPQRFLEG